MSAETKFKDAFVSTISDMDANKTEKVSGMLHELEDKLDNSIGYVVDKLKHGNSNFGVVLSNDQIRSVMKKAFDNSVHHI